jgi:ABC transporter DrrB family efflux protein
MTRTSWQTNPSHAMEPSLEPTHTAAGLADDLGTGSIDRFRSLPMSRLAVLAGRTFSDLARSAVTLLLMLAVGVAIGFRWQTNLLGLIAGLAVALAFGYALSWLMAFLGLIVQSAEAVQAAVYMVVFPLGFTSAVFVPTQTMPTWLQGFAEHQPVTVAANARRRRPGTRADRGRPGRLVPGVGRGHRGPLRPPRRPHLQPEPIAIEPPHRGLTERKHRCTPPTRDA